jgi:hypothetical protein
MVEEAINSLDLKQGNISLILDSYNDIFSSFDPRNYLERALSDDFLDECKRAARDKENAIELRLLIPKNQRNLKEEWKIKKRLHEHFAHHSRLEEKEIKKLKWEGMSWFGLGTVFILSVAYLHKLDITGFIPILLITMLEPAGWFSFWEGLGKIFITAREKSPNLEFYEKMSKAEINFTEY